MENQNFSSRETIYLQSCDHQLEEFDTTNNEDLIYFQYNSGGQQHVLNTHQLYKKISFLFLHLPQGSFTLSNILLLSKFGFIQA